jgi:3'(2'), 5'-bisphosphate nucleotidase
MKVSQYLKQVRALTDTLQECVHAEDLVMAAEAVLHGGTAVLEHYCHEDLVVEEATGGPVTSADRASHSAILKCLSSAGTPDPVLSEEGTASCGRIDGGRVWIVDPLDGTREFIDRIGEFSVMVGLAVDGSAALGAVYRPDPDVLYIGVSDRVAWRIAPEDGELKVRRLLVTVDSDKLRFVCSRNHPDRRLEELERNLRPSHRIFSGSVGTKCALIAEGRADLYVHPVPYLKEWDTCAPEAVLRGAGGRVTDCLGGELTYGKANPVQPAGIFAAATNDLWHRVAPTVLGVAEGFKK